MKQIFKTRIIVLAFMMVYGLSFFSTLAQDGSSAMSAELAAVNDARATSSADSTPQSDSGQASSPQAGSSQQGSGKAPSTSSPQAGSQPSPSSDGQAGQDPPQASAPPASSPASANQEPTPNQPQEEGSGVGAGMVAALVSVLAIAGFGLFRLQSQRNSKEKEEKDDSHCLNIKKLVDEKFKELTDLKGQLKSKVEEKGREILRESVEGTSAGDALAAIEKAEAEYQRLKNLLSECELKLSKTKNAILLHGTGDSPDLFWFPYLKENLEKRGFKVWAPHLPNAEKPNLEDWLPFVLKGGTFNEETILVGHSSGARLILSILDTVDVKIKQGILVSSFARTLRKNRDDKEDGDTPHWENIRRHVGDITFINSDNDPWGCDDAQGRILHDHLGGKLIVRHEGHMGSTTHNQPYKEFPLLLDLIAK